MFMMFMFYLAIELIKELMNYEVADSLLSGLVSLLRPAVDDIKPKEQEVLDGKNFFYALAPSDNKNNCLNFQNVFKLFTDESGRFTDIDKVVDTKT